MVAGVVPLVIEPVAGVLRLPISADMSTREYERRGDISGFRCALLEGSRAAAFDVPRPDGKSGQCSISSLARLTLRPRRCCRRRPPTPLIGPVGHLGLFFLGVGDEQRFFTAGAGQTFSSFNPADLAGRLQRVLTAMIADPGGGCRWWMCSMRMMGPDWRSGVGGRCRPRRR